MTTREHVALLKYQANKWNRTGVPGIIPIFNQAQNLLYMVEHPKNIDYDDTTGDLPYVTTTAGTYRYAMPANIWRVSEILIADENYPMYGSTVLANYGSNINVTQPIDKIGHNGKKYVRYQQVNAFDKTEDANASILFVSLDPGDTTDTFYRMSYKLPTQITTITTNPTIPPPLDFEFLLPAAQALIDGMEHGTFRDAMQYIRTTLALQFWNKIAGGANATSYHVSRRKI